MGSANLFFKKVFFWNTLVHSFHWSCIIPFRKLFIYDANCSQPISFILCLLAFQRREDYFTNQESMHHLLVLNQAQFERKFRFTLVLENRIEFYGKETVFQEQYFTSRRCLILPRPSINVASACLFPPSRIWDLKMLKYRWNLFIQNIHFYSIDL